MDATPRPDAGSWPDDGPQPDGVAHPSDTVHPDANLHPSDTVHPDANLHPDDDVQPDANPQPDDGPGPNSIVRCRVIVVGRVQGVFYRDTCRRVADRLSLCGWVRNRSDGTVEAVIEGDRDDVGELLAWCRAGPPRSIVTDVQIVDEPVVGEGPFRIVG